MCQVTPNLKSEVRQLVREAQNVLSNPKTDAECVEYMERMLCLLPSKESKVDNKLNFTYGDIFAARKEFLRNHYSRFIHFLVDCISVEWLSRLRKDRIHDLFDAFFFDGIPEEAFKVLSGAVQSLSLGMKLNKCVLLLEKFIRCHKLRELLWNQCQIRSESCRTQEHHQSVEWEDLVSTLALLPEKICSKLKEETSDIFFPKSYISFLANEVLQVLHQVYNALKNNCDIFVSFLSQLLGKLCITGNADLVWSVLLPNFISLANEDFIWCRICERLVCGVPDRCIESTIFPIVRDAAWYGAVNKLLGDAILSKPKLKYLLTNKLLLFRYFKQDLIIQNVLGHLASSHTRKSIFIKALQTLLDVWGDGSAVKHTAYEQQHYITRAVLISIGYMSIRDKEEYKEDLIRRLMPGVQCHIDNQSFNIRLLGMIVAEVVTKNLDPGGHKLEFEYEKTEEVVHLLTLVNLPSDPGIGEIQRNLQLATLDVEKSISEKNSTREQKKQQENTETEELDSDDDLESYDMSNDIPLTKTKTPRYVRDCMEGLISSDDPERVETCLIAAVDLIRHVPVGLKETAVEFTKILLHLQDNFTLANFNSLRHNALVALGVACPVEVSAYLTKEFYERNYNIRQRIDILEAIAVISKGLSQPWTLSIDKDSTKNQQKLIQVLKKKETGDSDPEHWREVVQKRIESKTRRFSQVTTKSEPEAVKNCFAPVAGDFFFPLLSCFDRQDLTFDLLGEDSLLLGRLVYTLGVVVYAATNAPIAKHMGKSLLEFTWAIRYHTDRSIRQAILFAVSMTFLAMPSHVLLTEIQEEVLEVRKWLEDVSEKDVDKNCQTLAAQTLLLLQHTLSQELSTMSQLHSSKGFSMKN